MTTAERPIPSNLEFPFLHDKIPVVRGLADFERFADQYHGFSFCPYVADKDEAAWDISTSRVYMNQVLPDFLYVPVNITGGDVDGLRDFLTAMQARADVPAVNITQPHKSSPVLRELFLGAADDRRNVDTLIRDKGGKLQPHDLNSEAFVEWFKADVGPFEGRTVTLLGVGGVGEPIAKRIAAEKPRKLHLVDVTDKSRFAEQLAQDSGTAVTFETGLALGDGISAADSIVINAAGKEGADNDSSLRRLVETEVSGESPVFVDIRPHLNIDVVEKAKQSGWDAYTGYGMNARNDYVLLQGIARNMSADVIPTFEEFQRLVAKAS